MQTCMLDDNDDDGSYNVVDTVDDSDRDDDYDGNYDYDNNDNDNYIIMRYNDNNLLSS